VVGREIIRLGQASGAIIKKNQGNM